MPEEQKVMLTPEQVQIFLSLLNNIPIEDRTSHLEKLQRYLEHFKPNASIEALYDAVIQINPANPQEVPENALKTFDDLRKQIVIAANEAGILEQRLKKKLGNWKSDSNPGFTYTRPIAFTDTLDPAVAELYRVMELDNVYLIRLRTEALSIALSRSESSLTDEPDERKIAFYAIERLVEDTLEKFEKIEPTSRDKLFIALDACLREPPVAQLVSSDTLELMKQLFSVIKKNDPSNAINLYAQSLSSQMQRINMSSAPVSTSKTALQHLQNALDNYLKSIVAGKPEPVSEPQNLQAKPDNVKGQTISPNISSHIFLNIVLALKTVFIMSITMIANAFKRFTGSKSSRLPVELASSVSKVKASKPMPSKVQTPHSTAKLLKSPVGKITSRSSELEALKTSIKIDTLDSIKDVDLNHIQSDKIYTYEGQNNYLYWRNLDNKIISTVYNNAKERIPLACQRIASDILQTYEEIVTKSTEPDKPQKARELLEKISNHVIAQKIFKLPELAWLKQNLESLAAAKVQEKETQKAATPITSAASPR